MNITILIQPGVEKNPNYVRLLTTHPGFTNPTFLETQYPDGDWLKHLTYNMTKEQAIELYNHYVVWLQTLKNAKPQIILYNNTVPNQPDWVLAPLLQVPIQGDALLYGKYSDLCYLYKQVGNVPITSSNGNVYNFGLYKTVSPYGGYAYQVTPSGAQKLIGMIMDNPVPIDQMINRLAETSNVITYNPSLISLDEPQIRYECRTPGTRAPLQGWTTFIWFLIFFILLGALIGAVIYLVSSKLQYQPGKEIPIDYIGPETVVNVVPGPGPYFNSLLSPSPMVV